MDDQIEFEADARAAQQLASRRQGYLLGLWAEMAAAVFLWCKGYRILARRARLPSGEIDLIARRGNAVAFVEVKARRTLSEAQSSISRRQQERNRRAAAQWIGRRPRFQALEQRFDALYIVPGCWPVHIPAGG